MMTKKILTIALTRLTNGAFAEMFEVIVKLVKEIGPEVLQIVVWATTLEDMVATLDILIDRQKSYLETPKIAKLDRARDAMWKAYYNFLERLQKLPEDNELYEAALTLYRVSKPYRGMHEHELSRETKDMDSFLNLVMSASEPYAKHVQKLGLTNLVKALDAVNTEIHTEIMARQKEIGARYAKYADLDTRELRVQITETWETICQRVEAVMNLATDEEQAKKVGKFIDDVNGVMEDYRLTIAQMNRKSTKDGDDPELESGQTDETTAEEA